MNVMAVMDTFSFSRLNLYQNCPRRFYYKYILQLDDPSGLPAIFGKTVHKAIELVINGRSFNDSITSAWIEESEMNSEISRDEIEWHVRNATRFIFNGKPETHFLMELEKGIKLQGYIDLSGMSHDGYYTVLDWKTGRNQFDVLSNWQIPLYAAYVMKNTGCDAVMGMLVFTRFNSVKREIITKDIAEQAIEWAVNTAKTIQSRIEYATIMSKKEIVRFAFPSSPCGECSHCPWARECLVDDSK
jgi:RecB family exonuclease